MTWVIVAVVILHQIITYRRRRVFDVLSVEILLDLVILVLFVYPALTVEGVRQHYGGDLKFSCMIVGGILALYLGLSVLRTHQKPLSIDETCITNPGWLWLGLGIFGLSILYVSFRFMSHYGISSFWTYFFSSRNISLHDSVDTLFYGSARGFIGAWLYQAVNAGRIAALMLLAVTIYRRKRLQAAFIFGVLVLGILTIFRTRVQVVLTLSLPIAYYHYRFRRISVMGMILGFIVFNILMALLDSWRAGGLAAFGELAISPNYVVRHFDNSLFHFKAVEWLWHQYSAGTLKLEYGLNYFYGLITFIPRFLWHAKPLVAFSDRWTFAKQGTAYVTGIWTFTAWGEGLVQFGMVGVFINLFLYGSILSWARARLEGSRLFTFVWYYYIILAAFFLRDGFQAVFVQTIVYFGSAFVFYRLSTGAVHLVGRVRAQSRARSSPFAWVTPWGR